MNIMYVYMCIQEIEKGLSELELALLINKTANKIMKYDN